MKTMLKICILTTDTPHHRYFVNEIFASLPSGVELASIVFETRKLNWKKLAARYAVSRFPNLIDGLLYNPYIPSTRLEANILKFERENFFKDNTDEMPQDLEVVYFDSVNGQDCHDYLIAKQCDVFFVFGTGLIAERIFSLPRIAAINAHGGRLPDYRGLDTNLWAIFEGRALDMAVSMHLVEKSFDTGALVEQEPIPLDPGLSIVNLRFVTTKLIVKMTKRIIRNLVNGRLEYKEQQFVGRYYGPMPHIYKLKSSKTLSRLTELQ